MSSKTEELLQAGYRYALALRCKEQDAQDLVHEAWIRLNSQLIPLVNRPRLVRTIRNLYIDRYRREQILVVESLDEAQIPVIEDTAVFDHSFAADDLDACLAKLRPPEREALFLNSVEGYTAAEIARITGRPRGTVLSLVHRARLKMKGMLMDYDSPGSRVSQLAEANTHEK
ncbi:RNA polymerase sigma factor [Marinobacter sp.]|uniref:RNA polymerase sigma factor n=1 Tax=Marinobacter sp. TaxID=50741 RepID=UPI0019E1E0C0|nr:RNA polymerase sigma factor [Marinobacter sp.]MBE0486179.1 RNA polymerase sigma factor [Marinobacter sp.]